MRGKHLLHILVVALACGLASCKTLTYTQLPFANIETSGDKDWAHGSSWGDSISIVRKQCVSDDKTTYNREGSPLDLHFDSVSVWARNGHIHIRQISANEISSIAYSVHKDTICIQQEMSPSTEKQPTHITEYCLPIDKIKHEFVILRFNNSFSIPIIPSKRPSSAIVYPLIGQTHQDSIIIDKIKGHWEGIKDNPTPAKILLYGLDINKDGTWFSYRNKQLLDAGVFLAKKTERCWWTVTLDSAGIWNPPVIYYRDIKKDEDYRDETYRHCAFHGYTTGEVLDTWPNYVHSWCDGTVLTELRHIDNRVTLLINRFPYYKGKSIRKEWRKKRKSKQ